ncbi:MAG: DMT family transporter [Gammaproteobacteria bacterium]|jgi:drug/metabolite transporter (DMT)-like permease
MTTESEKASKLAFVGLITGALCISLAPILVRMSEIEPNATAFQRVFLALPILFIWMMTQNRKLKSTLEGHHSTQNILWLFIPGMFFAADIGFWHWSIRYTTIANATLFANFAPVYVTLAAVVIYKEKFSKNFLIALLIAIIGTVILMGTSANLSENYLKGDVLGMITAIFYAAYLISVGRLRSRFNTATVMFWSSLTAAVILLPVSIYSGDTLFPETQSGWFTVIALAWISHVAGQGLIVYALAHLSTAFSSLSLLVQPVCAALLAWFIFSESLTALQIMGGVIVLSGIYLARRSSSV